jgi:hypothetical protein
MRQVEVSREDIERHIMRIRAREADTIESVDATDLVEEIPKWGLENLLCKGGARRAEDFYLLFQIFFYSF